MILVVGATGFLGLEVCRRLRQRGEPVRALYRESSSPERLDELKRIGAELALGDLKDRASLERACRGVDVVIETASSTLSRQPGDTIDAVDRQGSLELVSAARQAGVAHFIYISFPEIDDTFPLQDAKRAVEQALRQSGMTYTILQPTFFMEIWLSPAVGFDLANARATLYGTGEGKISWITVGDVAEATVACIDNPRVFNKTFELGGPEPLSHKDIVAIFEELGAPRFTLEHVTEAELRQRRKNAEDPASGIDALAQSFDALMLHAAGGKIVDVTGPLEMLSIELTPLRTYAARALRG
jgi:NADH dehydrogenase